MKAFFEETNRKAIRKQQLGFIVSSDLYKIPAYFLVTTL